MEKDVGRMNSLVGWNAREGWLRGSRCAQVNAVLRGGGGYFAGTVLFNSKEFNFRVSTWLRIRLKNSACDLR